jgi:hypothetical protein
METPAIQQPADLLHDRLPDMGLSSLAKPAMKPLSQRSAVMKQYLTNAREFVKGPVVYLQQSLYLTPGRPQGNLKSHLSFFQASMVLTESAAGKNNNQVLFGSRQGPNGTWLGSDGSVQVEFETEDTQTGYLVEFHLNLPQLSGPPMQWYLTLVGYQNALLTSVDYSFSSSQKGNRVLQFFVSPSQLRSQHVLLRPTWAPNQPTSTWTFYGVEITAFKS